MFFYSKFAIFKKVEYKKMSVKAGFEFIIFLILFGFTNYLMMLRRYEYDIRKQNLKQRLTISKLYPKGTYISK